MLQDLETLALRCQNSAGYAQIREAIKGYEAGAYRGAVILAWVSVCVDLLEKLRELAADGDGRARDLINSFDTYRQQLDGGDQKAIAAVIEMERNLAKYFRDDFQFFGNNEFIEIDRLQLDRNRCAHPSYDLSDNVYQPTSEAARAHLVSAMSLVLSRSPTSGKAVLGRLLALVASEYFPRSTEAAKIRLEGSEFRRPRQSLIVAFSDALLFGVVEKDSALYKKTTAVWALTAVIELHRATALPRVSTQLNKLIPRLKDQDIWIISYLLFASVEIADVVDLPNRATLCAWLAAENDDVAALTVNFAAKISWMSEAATQKSFSLTAEQLSRVTASPAPPLVDRAVELYCHCENWAEANSIAELCVIPFSASIGEQHLAKILSAATDGSSDLLGSHGFRDFIDRLYEVGAVASDAIEQRLREYHLERYIKAASFPDGGNDPSEEE